MTAQAIAHSVRQGRIGGWVILGLELEGVGVGGQVVDQDVMAGEVGGGGLGALDGKPGADGRVGGGLGPLAGVEQPGREETGGGEAAKDQQAGGGGQQQVDAQAHSRWIPAR